VSSPQVATASSVVVALVDTRDEYQALSAIYLPIAVGAFVAVVAAMVVAVLRYRHRSAAQAARWHESNRLEATYAVLLALIVAFLLYLTFAAEHRVDNVSAQERPSVVVDVTGAKWEWQFTYPAFGITLHSGAVGRQDLVVPVDEPIRFNLASQDVIHSFWVPELRFKRDLIPGGVEHVTLAFDQRGSFEAQCAEFCGLQHADMVFTVRVLSPAGFAAWARGQAHGSRA
jgi:cytochrome c oxidase subunit 2